MRRLFLLLLLLLGCQPALAKPQLPVLQFSVPCLEVKDPEGKPPDLLSLFYELPLPEFPYKTDFAVANSWCKGSGQFRQSMRIIGPNKRVLVETGDQPFQLTSTLVPFMAINRFEGIVFEHPGVYQFEVYLEKNKVFSYPINVRRSGPKKMR